MQAISLDRVSKHWGAARAVDDVSFEVEAGSLVVLLGPSGCGKSTTLRLIAGLERVDSGRVSIGGSDVTAAPPSKRRIAMVFQSYALFPHLTVAENIQFGLAVRRVAKAEQAERLARVAGLLGLSALLHRKPSQLSGGQQQRVALGRAIIAEQPVCLMDEPLSNLDAQLRQEMRNEIRALQQSLGMTMVYVTHDQAEAMSMADRVILMREGRIEQDATPSDLYERPATLFAARFIGTPPMNILPLADGPGGAVVAGSAGPALFGGGGAGWRSACAPEAIVLDEIRRPAGAGGRDRVPGRRFHRELRGRRRRGGRAGAGPVVAPPRRRGSAALGAGGRTPVRRDHRPADRADRTGRSRRGEPNPRVRRGRR